MKRTITGLSCLTMLLFASAAAAKPAQGPKGAGADSKVERPKKEKTKFEKPIPIYSVPKSAPGWSGGGPGPAGVGA